jgi:hypothetical protein
MFIWCQMGKLKMRIRPRDITINIAKDAPIPECPIRGERFCFSQSTSEEKKKSHWEFFKDKISKCYIVYGYYNAYDCMYLRL